MHSIHGTLKHQHRLNQSTLSQLFFTGHRSATNTKNDAHFGFCRVSSGATRWESTPAQATVGELIKILY